jgi:lipoprotein-anchoring transpeptidase ErfK/SrfK
MGQKVVPPPETPTLLGKRVLGETTNSTKRIYVDLTNQYLYAIENNQFAFGFPISSGLTNRTPTGDFRIWIKLKYTRMRGGSVEDGTYYDLPNVPYTMFFYNDQVPKYLGYSLHGAYWHNNFGHPMSHGCVNISPENAKILYDWANPPSVGNVTYPDDQNPGTLVTIFGTTPPS